MARDDKSTILSAFAALTAVGAFLLAAVGVFIGATTDGGGGGGGGAPATPIGVSLTEFAVSPDPIQAPTGEVVLALTNDGGQVHNLQLEGGPVSSDLAGGASETISLGSLQEGTFTVFCNIAGHREAGMEAQLVVSEDAAAPSGGGHGDHSSFTPEEYAAMDLAMEESVLRFSALDPESDTGVKGNVPLEPVEVEADGTKVFEMTAAITEWEVEPGKFVDAWTYNGTVPGPWLKLDLNDKIKVRIINELPMGTDVHWHGVGVPFDQDGVAPITQPLIKSGETYTYAFTVDRPAVAMYHPHHHGQLKLPNGMFGAVTVGELGTDIPLPDGRLIGDVQLPDDIVIDHEFPMVLNDSGVIGLALNGKSFPATDAFVGEVGDWVAVHYFNEGNQIHPMHQHQFDQLVVAKDGRALAEPYWVDTLNVAPGERYTVLLELADPGVWVWHCHILTHAERAEGMFGMVTAWIVGTPGEDFALGGTGSAE